MMTSVIRKESARSIGLILLAALMGASLGACSKSKQAAETSAGAEVPFTINLGSEPTTLNPITSQDAYASDVQAYIIESLLTRNVDTYAWEPMLAEKWEISKDGREFTFTLRDGVKWHDGKPLTVEDVKFSFDVIFDDHFPTAHQRPYYEQIEKVDIVDAKSVRFRTKDTYFKNFDVVAGLSVIPKHIYGDAEKGPKISKELIGTGPYKLGQYERGKRIVLDQNADWWGRKVNTYFKDLYQFPKIAMRFVNEDAIAIEMLKKGDLDYFGFSPQTFAERAQGPEWGTKVMKVQAENRAPKNTSFIGWNLRNPLFAERNVRQALYHLVNRDLMIEKFRFGLSLPATGPWYRQNDAADASAQPVKFDQAKAGELLKAAGWGDSDKDGILDKVIKGQKTPFKFSVYFANPDSQKYLTLFKEDAKKVGVEVEVKQLEWNSFIKLIDERKFDAVMLSWTGSVEPDPKQIWHSKSDTPSGSNFIGYRNAKVDALIDKARSEMNATKRLAMMKEVYREIADDVPYAFLFNDRFALYGHTARVQRTKDSYTYSVGSDFWTLKGLKTPASEKSAQVTTQ
jgi:microcin C transport system substrate-binding protein